MQHSYLLAGISSGKLFRLLSRNGFSLYPKYIFRILFLLQGSIFASVFNRIEKIKLSKKLKKYSMPADPVFIIGHWRTGTTLLHQIITLDDNLVTPSVFHVSTPESFLISEKFYRPVMTKAMKSTRPMDNVKLGFDEPQEEEYALIKMTLDSPLERMIFPNGKKYFLLNNKDYNPENIEKWKKALYDFCVRLSFMNKKIVLLKNPFHSMRIPLLLELFPGAKFIHIHRHPYEVIPSTIHMWNVVGNENKLKRKFYEPTVEEVAIVFDRLLTKLKDDLAGIPENKKVEVRFNELGNDPVSTLKQIYNKLELNYSPEFEIRMKGWLSGMKSYRKNKYKLSEAEKETLGKILGKHFIYYNYKR